MLVLNVILGLTAIAWIIIGIKTHADWVVNVFDQESRKIKNQQILYKKTELEVALFRLKVCGEQAKLGVQFTGKFARRNIDYHGFGM